MTFGAPIWLVIGLGILALSPFGWRYVDRRRREALSNIASSDLHDRLTANLSVRLRTTKRWLILLGVLLCTLALAAPQVGFEWQETQRRGVDVLVAVDVSRSMNARDVSPDRLGRAKLAVRDLVAGLEGDRLGLIAFAGTAFLQCPLTLDDAAFRRALAALDPEVIPAAGSNLASALDAARKALASEHRNIKLLILLSDGEDLRGGALEAARKAAEAKIRVYTVGVGTPAGELIPASDAAGDFLKDAEGRIVKSKLDEATLERVASLTGGFYVPLGPRGEGIETIIRDALASLPREELASRMRRVPQNRYAWPLGLALLLLAIEPWVDERSRRKALIIGLCALGLSGASAGTTALAASPDSAAKAYAEAEFDKAAAEFETLARESGDPRWEFNLGTALYRAGRFDEAAGAFERALRGEDPELEQKSFYDLGNAHYRRGEAMETSAREKTTAAWKQAIAAYEEALALDEGDEDARFNRDLVLRKLEELEQQQDPSEQDDSSNEDEEDSSEQDDSSNEDEEDSSEQDDSSNEDEESSSEQDDSSNEDEEDSSEQDDSSSRNEEDPSQQDGPSGQNEEDPSQQDDSSNEDEEDSSEQDDSSSRNEEDPSQQDGPSDEGTDESSEQERPPGEDREDARDPPGEGDEREEPDDPTGGGAGSVPPDRPGQLTQQQARELLDSLQGDEEFLPMLPLTAGSADANDPRNW
jgi:Ca-activated chloride channel family protein